MAIQGRPPTAMDPVTENGDSRHRWVRNRRVCLFRFFLPLRRGK